MLDIWILFIFTFIFIFKYCFDIISSCKFPHTKRLNNANNLLICSDSIYFYDIYFENIISQTYTSYNCNSSCVISTAYSQFLPEDNGYIVIFQNGYIYIFSEDGILLSNITTSYYNPGKLYSLISYGHSNNEYYYALIYTDNRSIIFQNYEYYF